ncbi:hypothetical protein U91I_03739 [alpha proteobacterium U9-1i]|nr:hypothetical protein U91I_03739 [alpha proteobacterium U9-1i]
MKKMTRRLALAGFGVGVLESAVAQEDLGVRHHGVLVRVPDLDAAMAFYCDGLGFPIGEYAPSQGFMRLSANLPIYLDQASEGVLHAPNIANAELTFQSANLEASSAMLRSAGAEIVTLSPFEVAVGRSIRFADPFGIIHHVLQPTRMPPAFSEPKVYNCGFELPVAAISPTRGLLEQHLGFVPMTERYFPPSIPYLEHNRSFAFMLHHHQPGSPDLASRIGGRADDLGTWQVFTATSLARTVRAAEAGGATLLAGPRRFHFGRRASLLTPGGGPFEVWEWG